MLGALTQTNTNIVSANTQLKAYSDGKFLANSTGTFNGDLTIAGNANLSSYVTIANSTFDSANHALVQIIGSTGALFQPPANPGYMLEVVGIDGVSSRIINTGYGTGAYALFAGRKGNGTAGSPTAVVNNDVIARFSGSGYNGSAFTTDVKGYGAVTITPGNNGGSNTLAAT